MLEGYDGLIRHKKPDWPTNGWVDEWWGPGGHLVVARLDQTSPAAELGVDALETLYRPDGTTVQHALAEAEDYHTLPELFGPELWAQRQKDGHAAQV